MTNTTQHTQGFTITDSKGFHITFENGWTISVQFGSGNYGDNYNRPFGEEKASRKLFSTRSEIAIWDDNGKWFKFSDGDEVQGYQTPAQVLEYMNMIAAKAKGGAA